MLLINNYCIYKYVLKLQVYRYCSVNYMQYILVHCRYHHTESVVRTLASTTLLLGEGRGGVKEGCNVNVLGCKTSECVLNCDFIGCNFLT